MRVPGRPLGRNKALHFPAQLAVASYLVDATGATATTARPSPILELRSPQPCCEVCREVATSWQQVVRRVLRMTMGGALTYALFLRFVASRETVRRQLSAIVRFAGDKVFRYRVAGAEHIPASGPALLCCYHGFIPLDMYFFHEYVSRVTGERACWVSHFSSATTHSHPIRPPFHLASHPSPPLSGV